MSPRVAITAFVSLASMLCLAPSWANPKPPEIFPLEQVRPGQRGYGLTTFQGTTPERFEFEVIGVNKNFLPKMDIILVKSDDPKLAVTGFWRGMSGSPLFIDGKLACAFSYGFRFNKVSMGGCTPLQYMTQEGFQPPRRSFDENGTSGTSIKDGKVGKRSGKSRQAGADARQTAPQSVASMRDWLRIAPERTVDSALQNLGKPRQPWFTRAPLPRLAPRQVPERGDDMGMVAASVPLAMSGFSAPAFAEATTLMSQFPVEPMRAGGTGNPGEGPHEFQLGSAIGVQILRGDMSAAATGTVSYVDSHRILGFGHPLFQAGELYAPVTAAEVHTVIPSAMSAFVIASPLRELGSLVQDRQSTIMADTRLETRMIPMDIYIETLTDKGDKSSGEFHVEVMNNRFMTGVFAGVAAMNAISYYLPDRDHTTVHMESTVHVRGYKPLHFVDYLYAEDGVGSVIGGARALRALIPLLNNPFAPVEIDRVELRAQIRYDVNYGTITNLRLPTTELAPGKRSHVFVHMTTYDGAPIVEKVPFDVPASLAGAIVRLEVTAGDAATLDAAPPETLDDLMAALHKLLPGNVLAVTLYSADEGVAIKGKLVRDLPPSAMDRLHPGSRTTHTEIYRPMAQSIYSSRRVINGSQTLLVKIAEK